MTENDKLELTGAIASVIFQNTEPVNKNMRDVDASFALARRIIALVDEYIPTKAGALEVKYSDEEIASDYVLREQACWVEVGDIAIRIRHAGIGVDIELHPNYPSEGDGSPVAELSYDFDDMPGNIEEE